MSDHPLLICSAIAFVAAAAPLVFTDDKSFHTIFSRFTSFPFWPVLLVFGLCECIRRFRAARRDLADRTHFHRHFGGSPTTRVVRAYPTPTVPVTRDITSPQ
jgi:hypothetical protein